jgi:uncharacterized protein YjbI with pentapeptide repeats
VLLILAGVAIALVGAYRFGASQGSPDASGDDHEHSVALLQRYLDQMNRLLLEQDRGSAEVRSIARALTLATAPHLDGADKGDVVRFLYGAGLLRAKAGPVETAGVAVADVDLSGADLRDVVLGRWTSLEGANLRQALFDGARLDGVDFSGGDLSGASFRDTTISAADFSYADLRHSSFDHAAITGGGDNLPTTFASSCLSDSSFANVRFGSASQRLANVLFRKAQGKTVDFAHARRLDLVLAGDALLTDVNLEGTETRPPGWGATGPNSETWTRSQQREAGEPCSSLAESSAVSASG